MKSSIPSTGEILLMVTAEFMPSCENRSRGTAFLGGTGSETDNSLDKVNRLQFAVIPIWPSSSRYQQALPRLL